VATIVAVVAGSAAAYALVKLVIGLADLFPRRTIEGEVVRNRTYRTGHRLPKVLQWAMWSGRDQQGLNRERNRRTRHHLAVDDGSDDRVLAYEVREAIRREAPQGARVRMRVSPLLGYVSELTLLAPPPRSAAHEPAVAHPLVEDTITSVGAGLSSGLADVVARSAEITDGDGTPILEQTDDDGVTLGERLQEGRDQIDRLRADPKIASSPLAGLLDALASGLGGDSPKPTEPPAQDDQTDDSER
jgi:hypothetical protein